MHSVLFCNFSSLFNIYHLPKFQKSIDKLTLRLLYHLAINDIIRTICLRLCIFCADVLLRKTVSPFYVNSLISNIFWSLYLLTTLYLSIVKGKTNQVANYKYWLKANYIFLLGICFLPFITNSYGFSNNICSLKTNQNSLIWRLLITYIFIPLITTTDIILYTLIHIKLKKLEQNAAKSIILERGFIYIILIILQYFLIIIIDIITLEDASCFPKVIQSCVHIIISLHGLFNPNHTKIPTQKSNKKLVFSESNSELSGLEPSFDILNFEESK